MQIVLQPCGGQASRQRFADTIKSGVAMSLIKQHLSNEKFEELQRVAGTDKLMVWGFTPAKASVWRALTVGDKAAFCGASKAFFVGDVCYKTFSAELGLALWGRDDNGAVWDRLYFMTSGQDTDIPTGTLTRALGYDRLTVVQGALIREATPEAIQLLPAPEIVDAYTELVVLESASGENTTSPQTFNPASVDDARKRALRAIVQRQGQPQFRDTVLKAYGYRCAITGCDAVQALEAAHIVGYNGPDTNHVSNGLLLRADIHTLFDLRLLAVDTQSMSLVVAPGMVRTVYGQLAGRPLRLPQNVASRPSVEALDSHRANVGW